MNKIIAQQSKSSNLTNNELIKKITKRIDNFITDRIHNLEMGDALLKNECLKKLASEFSIVLEYKAADMFFIYDEPGKEILLEILETPSSPIKPIVSIPSPNHINRNEDTIKSFNHNNCIITICCDGVSRCSPKGEAPVNGFEASNELAQLLESEFRSNRLEKPLNNLKNILNSENNFEKIEKALKSLLRNVHQILTEIELDEARSATTLELTIELESENTPYLIAISYGDSETLLYNKTENTTTQLNSSLYKNGAQINKIEDLIGRQTLSRSVSTVQNYINGTGPKELGSLTWGKIDENSNMYITCTDGLTDALSKRVKSGSNVRLDKTFLNDLLKFSESQGYSDEKTAKFLTLIAVIVTAKPDDISVCTRHVSKKSDPNNVPSSPNIYPPTNCCRLS
ncbi:hypothetical protein HOG98_08430 [bacterium]|jgi:serine/threonine protein phosphatase PrpC|nr:hypothetical protein [bacterium]